MSKKKEIPTVSSPSVPARGKLTSTSPMDVNLLAEMVKLMAANDLNTVDVRDGEKRVILKRSAVQQTVSHAAVAPNPVPVTPAPTAPPAAPPAKPVEDDASLLSIKSPMVGTFYSAPSPDSKPFVTVGSTIDEETEVCTIEAMKNFMPIKSEIRGTIAKVLVANGQTVEFGQKLFLVKP